MLAALLVVGCSFEHGRLPGEQPSDDPDDPTGVDAATSITRVCKETDNSVRLCIELEDRVYDPIHDASLYQMDADPSGVIPYDRGTSPAAAIAGGQLKIAETSNLDIAGSITLETWIRIPFVNFNSPVLIMNDGQYGMTLEGRTIECSIGGTRASSPSLIGDNQWVHVACTYDGTNLRAYVDGVTSNCTYFKGTINTTATTGTRLFDDYTGAFDDVHIYSRALSESEICTRANKSSCAVSPCWRGESEDWY